ncbi:MAG: response regulator [Nitrospirae bacterium]|nr:response regulator [Nitrospirota bacterium]
MSILIIDDSEDSRVLLKSILEASGYREVLTAESANHAFMQLGLNDPKKGGGGVDLILLDVLMPEMDGVKTCREIKAAEHLQDIPIIMVTTAKEMEWLQLAFVAGAVDYITKPVNKVELLARVRSVLKLKHEMDSRKAREQDLAKKTQELQQALRELKVLRGFIPICASCKKVRNDKGYWQQVEAYIRDHSEAQFTHGFCPDCLNKLYPGFDQDQG